MLLEHNNVRKLRFREDIKSIKGKNIQLNTRQ